ncbi:MAG: DUF5615 family PIN-like protein [Saprospiraceae bacterium]|nr:DUF5615 family PIN-like protein [Saprospiraceae bacterium]
MRILADENIDYPIVQGLRALGFDVDTILEQEQGMCLALNCIRKN